MVFQRTRRFVLVTVFAALAAAVWPSGEAAAVAALDRSEAAVGSYVGNYRIIDQSGQFVAFHSLKGKPLLLTFIYVDCPGPCMLINQSVSALHDQMDPALAGRFLTLSMTIDPFHDTPERLRDYGLYFTDRFDDWKFARTDQDTLNMMADDLGFTFEKTADGFEHMNRLTLIGPDGKVLKHFYGTDYDPAEVESAVLAALEGRTIANRLSDTLSRALIYCSNYDPITKTYRIDTFFVASAVIQYLLIMGTLIFIFRRRIGRFFSRHLGRGAGRAN